MVMIIRLPRKIRRNAEINDLVARVLRREYFVLGWLSNLPKKKKKRTLLTYCMSLHKCPLSKFLINESMMKPFVYIKPSGEWEYSLRSRYMSSLDFSVGIHNNKTDQVILL